MCIGIGTPGIRCGLDEFSDSELQQQKCFCHSLLLRSHLRLLTFGLALAFPLVAHMISVGSIARPKSFY